MLPMISMRVVTRPPGVTVAPNATVRRAIVGPNAMVPENAQIGGNEPIALFMEKARTARKGART